MSRVRITFIRHGKTGEAATEAERRLSEEGVAQATLRAGKLGATNYDLVLVSPMQRTGQTAEIISDKSLVELEELWHNGMPGAELMDAIGAKLGYSSLANYLNEADRATTIALISYGVVGWQATRDSILEGLCDEGEADVLVVGHAILISLQGLAAMGYKMATESGLLALNAKECEGFRITVEMNRGSYNTKVTNVELICD